MITRKIAFDMGLLNVITTREKRQMTKQKEAGGYTTDNVNIYRINIVMECVVVGSSIYIDPFLPLNFRAVHVQYIQH